MNIFKTARRRIAGQNIELLKKRLAESDYKILKCVEYQLTGKDLPYDITALHTERQKHRDKVNSLKSAFE